MANHATTLQRLEQELCENITHIVIGQHANYYWSSDEDPVRPAKDKANTVLTREVGLSILDEEYNNGYGGPDCFPFYAWSENYFFTVSEYDGATAITHWPRHPINCTPKFD